MQLIHFHTLEACCTYLKETAGRQWAGYCSKPSLMTQGSCSHTLEVLCLHSGSLTLLGKGQQRSHASCPQVPLEEMYFSSSLQVA